MSQKANEELVQRKRAMIADALKQAQAVKEAPPKKKK